MAHPPYEQLAAENRRLRLENQRVTRRVAELEALVEAQRTQIQRLTAQVQEALRATKRQAAPFSKGPPTDTPKTPGRKAGPDYGTPPAHRPTPRPPPDEVHDAPLPPQCPDCGGPLVEDRQDQQYQVEIPRRPMVRRFEIHIGHCARCGRRVQGRHPLQTSDALGAAKSQVGPDAQAAIVDLNKRAGMSHGKIADYLDTLYHLALSRGGVCQIILRAARRAERTYQTLRASVRHAPWIVPDETGWRIGGKTAWLHGFVTPTATVYHIDRRRGYEAAVSVIGADYAGGLTHDGWAPYNRFLWALHQQCLNHLLTRCEELLAVAVRGAAVFPRKVQGLLWDALALRDRRDAGEVSPHGVAVAVGRLRTRLDRMLVWTKVHPGNERLAKHLDQHRNHLFTFLTTPGLDATNWRAEQAMRAGVVNRKVWGGNRTESAAHAQAVLMTILATARQHGRDTLALMSNLLCGRQPRLSLVPAGP
jgi:transposase